MSIHQPLRSTGLPASDNHDPEVVIRVSNVSKRFVIRKEKSLKERLVNFGRSNRHKEDFFALRSVNLDIAAGSTVGLIGPNGSGKSTLLKTIGGIVQPTSGEVLRNGRLAALLELGAGFHPDLTGRENVYLNASILGISRADARSHFEEIVEFAGIGDFIDTQVKFYSSGMYVRLAFAVAVHVDPDILIVDEVLAVGDEPFQRKCMDRIRALQRAGKTIILVTHSLDQVGDLCDRAIVLEHGSVIYDGDPGVAIMTLREGFEESRHEAERNSHEAERSSAETESRQEVAISRVKLLGLLEGPGSRLGTDRSLQCAVEITTSGSVGDVLVGMGIETALGHVVFGTNTNMLGLSVAPFDGRTVVTFDLTDLYLGAGQYTVHASVGTDARGEISRVPQAAVFNVTATGRHIGVIDAAVTVSSAPLDAT